MLTCILKYCALCSAKLFFILHVLIFYLFIFHLFLLAGGKLRYNTAVVSAMHWHESAMDWHVLPIPIPPPHPVPLGHPRAPNMGCMLKRYCPGVKSESASFLSRPALCKHSDCSPPGSSAHGVSQARILGWVAPPFSSGSFQPRTQTQVSCISSKFFIISATREVPWVT